MLSTQFNRDNQHQAIIKPSLLAGCIALALLPSAAFAAPATEETVIVEGSATAPDDGENDYNVTSTSAGTKMQMTQRDIPQSVTIVSQQRMEDQQLQTLGEVMENTLGISKTPAVVVVHENRGMNPYIEDVAQHHNIFNHDNFETVHIRKAQKHDNRKA